MYKRGLRISNMFKFKDCFPLKCKSGIVYSIQCNKCGQSKFFFVDARDPPMDAGFFRGETHFYPNDHCTARGLQHFD